MALVMDTSVIERSPVLQSIARTAGVTSHSEALLLFGMITAGVIALANVAGALNILVQEQFAARTKIRLSSALFAGYLRQPYAFHVRRDAPSLLKVLLSDIPNVSSGVFSPFLLGVSRALMALGVLILLFLQDPFVAFLSVLVLGLAYGVVFRVVRVKQSRLSAEWNLSNLDGHRIAQEGLGGAKELQVLGREQHAIERFELAARSAGTAVAFNTTVSQLPRYALETVAFGGILLVTLTLVADGGAQSVVPLLALYAFAGYRLLPALQQIYSSTMTIRFGLPALRGVHEDFVLVTGNVHRPPPETNAPELRFTDALRLDKVSFTYPGGAAPALRDVDLVIRPNESIGLVGRTGAGKTTLADIILGVYEPSAGSVILDGVPLSGPAIYAWRRRLGYVPQHVFLANASVAENIAFGLPPEQIDAEAVRRAARLAQADEYISGLPQGFQTLVGERGVKLSGGQRQRIGIARALYHQPEVLVFDEATSALDGLTEDAVMEATRSLSETRTVILIAHRLRTVEACDRIVMLEDGRVIADGPYHDLLQTSQSFRRFVGRVDAVSV